MSDKKKVLLITFGLFLIAFLWWRSQYLKDRILSLSLWKVQEETQVLGGQTPGQTLNLFLQAIDSNDPELASKYFFADNKQEKEEWREIMVDTFSTGNFPLVAKNLRQAKPDPDGIIGSEFYQFVSKDDQGRVVLQIDLIFDGQIWKIENL